MSKEKINVPCYLYVKETLRAKAKTDSDMGIEDPDSDVGKDVVKKAIEEEEDESDDS